MVSLAIAALTALAVELLAQPPAAITSSEQLTVEANTAVVQRYVGDILNGGDLAGLHELVAIDHRYHDPANPDIAPGADGLARFLAVHRSAFPDATVTIDDLVASGDRVVLRFTERATHAGTALNVEATDRQVTITGTAVFRLAHRQIAETWISWDAAGLAKQLGLYLVPASGVDDDWAVARFNEHTRGPQ